MNLMKNIGEKAVDFMFGNRVNIHKSNLQKELPALVEEAKKSELSNYIRKILATPLYGKNTGLENIVIAHNDMLTFFYAVPFLATLNVKMSTKKAALLAGATIYVIKVAEHFIATKAADQIDLDVQDNGMSTNDLRNYFLRRTTKLYFISLALLGGSVVLSKPLVKKGAKLVAVTGAAVLLYKSEKCRKVFAKVKEAALSYLSKNFPGYFAGKKELNRPYACSEEELDRIDEKEYKKQEEMNLRSHFSSDEFKYELEKYEFKKNVNTGSSQNPKTLADCEYTVTNGYTIYEPHAESLARQVLMSQSEGTYILLRQDPSKEVKSDFGLTVENVSHIVLVKENGKVEEKHISYSNYGKDLGFYEFFVNMNMASYEKLAKLFVCIETETGYIPYDSALSKVKIDQFGLSEDQLIPRAFAKRLKLASEKNENLTGVEMHFLLDFAERVQFGKLSDKQIQAFVAKLSLMIGTGSDSDLQNENLEKIILELRKGLTQKQFEKYFTEFFSVLEKIVPGSFEEHSSKMPFVHKKVSSKVCAEALLLEKKFLFWHDKDKNFNVTYNHGKESVTQQIDVKGEKDSYCFTLKLSQNSILQEGPRFSNFNALAKYFVDKGLTGYSDWSVLQG